MRAARRGGETLHPELLNAWVSCWEDLIDFGSVSG
jgi:hypothetical protein